MIEDVVEENKFRFLGDGEELQSNNRERISVSICLCTCILAKTVILDFHLRQVRSGDAPVTGSYTRNKVSVLEAVR